MIVVVVILFSRSIDHDAHTFVVHYNTYNSDATLGIDEILPLGEWKARISKKTGNIYKKTQKNT